MAIAPRRGSPRRDVHSVKVVEEFDLSSSVYLLGRTMNTETCCKRLGNREREKKAATQRKNPGFPKPACLFFV